MKKVFKIIGIIFVVLLVLIGLFVGGFFLYISHQHTKWARHFAEITPEQAQRAIAQMDELEKAVNKYVQEHGIQKDISFFAPEGNTRFCKDCLDIDLSHLTCNTWAVGECHDEEFGYFAGCRMKTQKCLISVDFPANDRKWYLSIYPYDPVAYEERKNCPNKIVGGFWAREVYPEPKNLGITCYGDPEKNALCTYLKQQKREKELKEYPNPCVKLKALKE